MGYVIYSHVLICYSYFTNRWQPSLINARECLKSKAVWSCHLLLLVSCLAYPIILKMEAMYSSENSTSILVFFSFLGWVETESTWYFGHYWPIVPAPDDRWWMWRSRWNGNWQGKRKYSEKTCPVPLSPPQIPHDMTWAGTRAAAVGSRRLTAWAMARPSSVLTTRRHKPEYRTVHSRRHENFKLALIKGLIFRNSFS
jgi:hypothetical protein